MDHRAAHRMLGPLTAVAAFAACGGSGQVAPGSTPVPAPAFDDTYAATASSAPARPKGRWDRMPPLAVEGQVNHRAHYDITRAGHAIGEERLAVSVVDGVRVVAAQSVSDFGGHFESSYTISPTTLTMTEKGPKGLRQITGKLVDGKLIVSGAGAAGEAITLSAGMPEGGFLSGPEVGGTLVLADKLGTMKVGENREFVELHVALSRAAKFVLAFHQVERKDDVDGQRVFSVATKTGRFAQTAELIVDGDGFVVKQAITPPLDLTFTRRPQ